MEINVFDSPWKKKKKSYTWWKSTESWSGPRLMWPNPNPNFYCLHRYLRPEFKNEINSFSSTVEGKDISKPWVFFFLKDLSIIYLSSTYFCSPFCKENFKILEWEKGLLGIYSVEYQSLGIVCSYRDVNLCLSLGIILC